MSVSDPDFDPTSPEVRLRDLEEAMAQMIWLHEEQRQTITRLAGAVAGMLAQQLAPRMQEMLARQLAGQIKPGAGWAETVNGTG